MKVHVIIYFPAEILSLRKVWFLIFGPKCSHPIRCQYLKTELSWMHTDTNSQKKKDDL